MKKLTVFALLFAVLLCGCTHPANTPSSNESSPSSTVTTTTTEKSTTTTTTTTSTTTGTTTTTTVPKPDLPRYPPALFEDTRPEVALPQADEQTIRWTLDFPDDLKVSTYQTPQLVAPEDFAWGEYGLFVEFEGGFVKNDEHYHRAFLGKDVSDLQQGQVLYHAFNDLYKTVYPSVNGIFEDTSYVLPDKEDLRQFLFESSVISVSPDLSRVDTFSFLYKGVQTGSADLDLYQQPWATEYKIYQDGQLDFSYQSPTYWFHDVVYDYGAHVYLSTYFDLYQPVNYPTRNIEWRDDEYLLEEIRDQDNQQYLYCLYSLKDNRMLYQITEPFNNCLEIDGYTLYLTTKTVLNGRFLLVNCGGTKEIQNGPYLDYIPFQACYLFDMRTGTWQHLENFACDAVVSPDGKYIAYTNWREELTLPEQPEGFYIKNLENGTTTYYPFEIKSGWVGRTPLQPLSFVHYDTLMQKVCK